ncbi:MAG: hypothetical protein AAF515_08770 [Pseudomonadota bacterium]
MDDTLLFGSTVLVLAALRLLLVGRAASVLGPPLPRWRALGDAGWLIGALAAIAIADLTDMARFLALLIAGAVLLAWCCLLPSLISAPYRRALPAWWISYRLLFAAGSAGASAVIVARHRPLADAAPLIEFLASPVGLAWAVGGAVAIVASCVFLRSARTQRLQDRGVLLGLRQHPRCAEVFGVIERVSWQPGSTNEVVGEDVLVYRVEGSRAAGVVVAEFEPARERLVQGLVYLDNGERSSLNAVPRAQFGAQAG